jgi:membrane protease YdiL (CAAX protease family)
VLGANTSHPDKGGVAIALTYVQDASWIVVVLFMAHVTADALARPIRPAALGVRVPELGRTIRWVGIAVALYAVFSLAFANLVHTKSDNIFHSLGVNRSSAGTVAALAVLVCVAAPIAEELLFRGFMFAALASWGPWVAAVIVGLLFGAVHAIGTPAILLVQLAVLGFLLCLVRWRTRSILPTVALHSINNTLAIGTLVHWTWQIPLLLLGAVPMAVGTVFVFALPEWRRRRAVT